MAVDFFLDTNILLYAYDNEAGEKRDSAARLVTEALCEPTRCATSVQVLQEFFVNFTRTGQSDATAATLVDDFSVWKIIANTHDLFSRRTSRQSPLATFALGCHGRRRRRARRCRGPLHRRPEPRPALRFRSGHQPLSRSALRMTTQEFRSKAITLIDDLKSVCANYGLGNDGNEFKIITQVFLYKFLNDKFAHEVKRLRPDLAAGDSWEDSLRAMPGADYELLLMQLGAGTARLHPRHYLSALWNQQNDDNFADALDDTLLDLAALNADIFSVMTNDGQKIVLFDRVTRYVASQRDDFARAIINKLIPFSFERLFSEKFDFYATLFEYLIKDYNKDGGGKYAEYYTPHAVAKIMAACLVPGEVQNVTCYDPAAGSGTLLMNLAHAIGEDRCTLYTQDISQKSSSLLRLNLILNNLVHSIPHVIQGNTIQTPYHREDESEALRRFDYIVSNPPFKLDFSDFRDQLVTKTNHERFFAGVPNVPKKDKDKMAIYLLSSSTSSNRSRRTDAPPWSFPPDSSPPRPESSGKSASVSSRIGCSAGLFPCRATSLRRPGRMFPSFSWMRRIGKTSS
jgi:hypothetical protein